MSAEPLRQSRPLSRAIPRSAPTSAPGRRDHLRAVSMPEHSRSLTSFAVLCVGIIVTALASVLLLNITMTGGAYERRDLKIEIANLHQQRASLVTELEANSSPQHLGSAATELGMVPAGTLGFVSLEDGIVLEHKGG